MSANKYKPHVLLIPEDDADGKLAVGFLSHYAVDYTAADIRAPAGGWSVVLDVFEKEYVPYLCRYQHARVVLLIDFDQNVDDRRSQCERRIPDDLKSRVFILGSMDEPEKLKSELGMSSLERIGYELAQDCLSADLRRWGHPHLSHNRPELERLVRDVKPFLFQ
jgi:hypothetical protein